MKKSVRLTDMPAGSRLVFIAFEGGPVRKLQEMGLLPAEKFSVLHNAGHGPVTVSLKGTTLAIGHSLASRIIVREG
jgi:Fe2+ transport system protein FeoA